MIKLLLKYNRLRRETPKRIKRIDHTCNILRSQHDVSKDQILEIFSEHGYNITVARSAIYQLSGNTLSYPRVVPNKPRNLLSLIKLELLPLNDSCTNKKVVYETLESLMMHIIKCIEEEEDLIREKGRLKDELEELKNRVHLRG